MKKLIIMGAHVPEIIRLIDYININQPDTYQIIGFIDNDVNKIGCTIFDIPVIGLPEILSEKKYKDIFVINNITKDPETRELTTKQLLKYTSNFATLVHPSVITKYCKIGKGTIIHEGSIISPGTIIGDHNAIMLRTTVAHDNIIGNYCFIGPGVILNGQITLGDSVNIGSGSIVLPRITIGNRVKIGAGSLIGENIPDNLFVMGNPPRIIPK
jgi:sugar O-acyltransferase (sialic acid O-acetyltransferase NeuD family)